MNFIRNPRPLTRLLLSRPRSIYVPGNRNGPRWFALTTSTSLDDADTDSECEFSALPAAVKLKSVRQDVDSRSKRQFLRPDLSARRLQGHEVYRTGNNYGVRMFHTCLCLSRGQQRTGTTSTTANFNKTRPKRHKMSLIAELAYADKYPEMATLNDVISQSSQEELQHDLETLLKAVTQDQDHPSTLTVDDEIEEDESDYSDIENIDPDEQDRYEANNSNEEGEYIEELQIDVPGTDDPELAEEKPKIYSHYGPDPSVPISDTPCSGCGAFLHCQNTGIPGYMPSEKFKQIKKPKLREHICERCFLMNRYNIALNVAVAPEEYRQIIAQVGDMKALVVVVVDVMDMPNSIFPNLKELIGKRRPLYIVGNKADLLAKDDVGYLDRTKAMLLKQCEEMGLSSESYIKHVCLISAKTGYGVEELVTSLMKDWARKGHVVILGCTNVGKSTLFNALLASDYCKDTARDYINRATTSLWPGTTLNLLKFPVIDPVPWRLATRAKRLLKDRKSEVEEQRLQDQSLKNIRCPTLTGHVGQTFEGMRNVAVREEDQMGFGDASFTFKDREGVIEAVHVNRDDFQGSRYDARTYEKSRWCYDTPGVVNPAQIINKLTQHELARLLSEDVIMPRTVLMKPGQSLWVSGLGRIDYISGRRSVYFTVFASQKIPINLRNYDEMDAFYRRHIGTTTMGVPLGDAERLRKLPSLIGTEMIVKGKDLKESAADILLSSIGWVAVTAETDMEVMLRAYTPGGLGCRLRTPALLPFAVNLKGKRTGSSRYHVKPLPL